MADQQALWQHYQVDEPSSFVGARPRLDAVARRVVKKIPTGASVLTVGVGNGHLERRLLALRFAVTALDPVQQAVDKLRSEGLDAHQGVLESLPFPEARFDAVVASEVLEHLTSEQSALGLPEIHRVLKPGGWFIGTVPANEDLASSQWLCPCCGYRGHPWGHQRSFARNSLARELRGVFGAVTVTQRAFVDMQRRDPRGLVKSSIRYGLGRAGLPMADPKLAFFARRSV